MGPVQRLVSGRILLRPIWRSMSSDKVCKLYNKLIKLADAACTCNLYLQLMLVARACSLYLWIMLYTLFVTLSAR